MHAFRLTAPHTIELRAVPQPEPGPGEVLVRVGAAGVCHSDLHTIDAPDALGMPIPLTLGHEIAGWLKRSHQASRHSGAVRPPPSTEPSSSRSRAPDAFVGWQRKHR